VMVAVLTFCGSRFHVAGAATANARSEVLLDAYSCFTAGDKDLSTNHIKAVRMMNHYISITICFNEKGSDKYPAFVSRRCSKLLSQIFVLLPDGASSINGYGMDFYIMCSLLRP